MIDTSAANVRRSVEVAKDFASNLLLLGLFVVHDANVGGQNNVTELTRREDGGGEFFEVLQFKIEAGWDDTALVEAAIEVNDNLAGTGIVDDGEFVDVTIILHKLQEGDQDLRDGSQNNLQKSIITIQDQDTREICALDVSIHSLLYTLRQEESNLRV